MTVAQALPRRNALFFASGSFAGNLLSRVVSAWLFYYWAADGEDGDVTRRMPVWLVGAILTITSLAGAFDDPLIGYWSDRTRSRWGRRIPFIVLATPPWALLFILLWTPPVAGESAGNVAYFFIVLIAYRILSTLSGAPMEALLPEIAPRNEDRVRIVVGQVLFATISAAIALVAAGPMIDLLGFQVMAVIMAVLALGSRYLALGGVWRYVRRDVPPVTLGLFSAYRSTFRNRQFLIFLPTFILFNMGITLLTATLPFFVEEVFQPPEGRVGTYSSLLAAVPIGALLLSLPLIQRIAVRWGKARVYSLSMLFGALYFPALFFMGFVPGVPSLLQGMIFMAPAGLAMAGVFVFPNALMADIVDYDELQTGMRREGIYYAAQNLVEGLTVAMHSLILAGLLVLGGTTENPLGIRLVGPVVGASILVGYLIFRNYRLPDVVTRETMPLAAGRV